MAPIKKELSLKIRKIMGLARLGKSGAKTSGRSQVIAPNHKMSGKGLKQITVTGPFRDDERTPRWDECNVYS